MELFYKNITSPIGTIEIGATADSIRTVYFVDSWKHRATVPERHADSDSPSPLLLEAADELAAYFAGKLTRFSVPFVHSGTGFQRKVWEALSQIPYGKTISYLDLSKRIGNPKAIRAVGTTNGSNRISIIVPCHRVIGSNGTLVGYGGELWRKQWLLEHEQKIAGGVRTLF
jgi:methylated-DNA-[protein]-cysteine S-methyltransferase